MVQLLSNIYKLWSLQQYLKSKFLLIVCAECVDRPLRKAKFSVDVFNASYILNSIQLCN